MKKLQLLSIATVALALTVSNSNALFAQFGGGSGIATDPYQIKTKQHLEELADSVNNGNNWFNDDNWSNGKYFKVMNDIAGPITTTIGRYSNYYYEGQTFQGNFDGNNKKITLAINNNTYYGDAIGLFGCVFHKCVLKSIVVDGYVTCGNSNAAGIVAEVYTNSGTISDTIRINKCINLANITSNGGASGIVTSMVSVWWSDTIRNGGIFIDSCVNYGNITGSSAAGILVQSGYYKAMRIKNCQNGGFIIASSFGGNGGGIATLYYGEIIDCLNHGTVTCNSEGGGIVARLYYYDNVFKSEVRNCINAGPVKGISAGGIVADSRLNNKNFLKNFNYIANCINVNSVQSYASNQTSIGGILGKGQEYTTIVNNHYDKQMCPIGRVNKTDIPGAEGHLTINMVGNKLQSKLGTANWHYDTNLYPQLKCLLWRWW